MKGSYKSKLQIESDSFNHPVGESYVEITVYPAANTVYLTLCNEDRTLELDLHQLKYAVGFTIENE